MKLKREILIENLKVIDAKDMTAEELQSAITEALKDMPFPDLSEIEKELRKETDFKKIEKEIKTQEELDGIITKFKLISKEESLKQYEALQKK